MNNLSAFSKKIDNVSNNKMVREAAPWLAQGARMTGLKALYDVPEYFRQKAELQGLKIGNKKFGRGLSGATQDLLKASAQKNRANPSESSVQDKISELNRKLSLTKEGSEKNSEARKEMARILWENRNKKNQSKNKIGNEVDNLFKSHLNQKVSGAQAAREAIRSALVASGVGVAAMPLVNMGASAVEKLGQLKQDALRNGKDFDSEYLANKIKAGVAGNIKKLKSLGDPNVPLDQKMNAVLSGAGKIGQTGLLPEGVGTAATLGSQTKSNFRNIQRVPARSLRNQDKQSARSREKNGVRNPAVIRSAGRAGRVGRAAQGVRKGARKGKVKSVRRLRASRATITALSVGFGIFYILQFFIGVAYLIGFAVLGALDAIITPKDEGFIAAIGSYIGGSIKSIADALLDLFGFSMEGLFIIALALSIAWTFITLITITGIYYVNGVNAMGGRGASTKSLTWLFVLISSIIPFLNMLPMFVCYPLVVWWKEK